MSILRYERPAAVPAGPVLDQALGSWVCVLGSLPVLWLLWLIPTLSVEAGPLSSFLAWGLVLLPVGALLLMLRLVTLPVAAQLGGRGQAGWALVLLLLSLLTEVGLGLGAWLVWQFLHGAAVPWLD
jgi:hypothetical protein